MSHVPAVQHTACPGDSGSRQAADYQYEGSEVKFSVGGFLEWETRPPACDAVTFYMKMRTASLKYVRCISKYKVTIWRLTRLRWIEQPDFTAIHTCSRASRKVEFYWMFISNKSLAAAEWSCHTSAAERCREPRAATASDLLLPCFLTGGVALLETLSPPFINITL